MSEPFITDQAAQLRRYRPSYLGRRRYGVAPANVHACALSDAGGWRGWQRIAWQTLTRDPGSSLRMLAGRKPALVHAHFGIDGVYALPLARRLGVPLVTTFHGFDATLSTAALLSSPAWFNFALFRAALARHGDLFLCVSSFIRDRVLAMGFPAERTHIHYTGVDCAAIMPRDPQQEMPVVLHVARLVEMKGTQYLIRAMAKLPRRHDGVRLVVVGDGPLMASLLNLANTLGIAGRIDFVGALAHDAALAWVRKAAMLVLPSVRTSTGRVEGLGMVLLEAAATGVPVVASRVGGIPDCVQDGQTGLLVPERDAGALAEAIARLLDEPSARQRMGAASRALVERSFDAGPLGALLENHYDHAVAGGPR